MLAVVEAAAETIFVPLTVGGGIKDTVDPDGTPRSALEVAGAYFRAGADKVRSSAVYSGPSSPDASSVRRSVSARTPSTPSLPSTSARPGASSL